MDSFWNSTVAITQGSAGLLYIHPVYIYTLKYPVVANITMQKLGKDKCIVYYSNKQRRFFYKTRKLFSFQTGFLYNVLPLERKKIIMVMCVSFVELCFW